MLQTTSLSSGKNEFKDYKFSAQEWSAPTMVDPEKIKARLESLKLEGRIIKQMGLIGLSYFHVRDWIENHAYDVLDQLDEEERQKQSNYNNIPPDILFGRNAEIDEPLLIEFEDGDILEIETPQQPEFRFSMNCIPWWIDAGTNLPNLDANILFSPCIGRTIKAIDVNTYITDKDPIWNDYFDDEHSQRELVSDIVLRLDDGNGISIGAVMLDYCEIALIDGNKELIMIPFQELKPALFNWEDLHIDKVSGFESNGSTLFFGSCGADHCDEPFMTLSPSNSNSRLHISVDDFTLLGWSIGDLFEWFDEYGHYEYSYLQWTAILDEAEKLLSFTTFDALFDYRTSLEVRAEDKHRGNYYLNEMNYQGRSFWIRREKFQKQLQEMRDWTSLVLKENDSISIYGF